MNSDETFPGEAAMVAAAEDLTYDTSETEAELLAKLPPPDAPVTVVRPVRLPFEMDILVKALAEARGVSMSTLIREWVAAGIAAAGRAPDPVTELRRGLDTAQRALDALTRHGGQRDAA